MKRGIIIPITILLASFVIILVSSQTNEEKSLPFIRGDINIDGRVNINDIIYLLDFFYQTHDNLVCEDAADIDDDGVVNMNDAMMLLDFLFIGNVEEIIAPNSEEEIDLTEDSLKC